MKPIDLHLLVLLFSISTTTIFVIFFTEPVLSSSNKYDYRFKNCSNYFNCGNIRYFLYPFWGNGRAQYCGFESYYLECKDGSNPKIQISSSKYQILSIDQETGIMRISRDDLMESPCPSSYLDATIDLNSFNYTPGTVNMTLFYGCNADNGDPFDRNRFDCDRGSEGNKAYYFLDPPAEEVVVGSMGCKRRIVVPVEEAAVRRLEKGESTVNDVLRDGFTVKYLVNMSGCVECGRSGGACGYDRRVLKQNTCFCYDAPHQHKCPTRPPSDNKKAMKIGVGIAGGVGGILLTCVAFFIYQRRRKLRSISSTLLSQTISSEPSSKPDLENGSMFHLTPIFKYDELVEATENFHSSKELGDGGFGTVYYGKLQDGRVVAVKRLYEHNYKRVEQFMNEIKILSLLRHPHLVFLYGCTSHDSRELLLVYEYVPNGTVADHLHGQRAKAGSLPWPVRMNIAIETADALAYLHATDIIHRDVKTTNILLDNNFHVKVADFGLSRLFPNDATHVSTAPQGTPGYVDPEYYQCYQLNSKSDVYSFGVVLIELISSKPAVDISRHRHEINLANMAVNKILNHALHELVDPSLGFESDYTVRRMITLVAELAFRCLQQEKEMRPTMKEVLECLKQIQSDEHTIENRDELDVGAEKGLLKGMNPPFSPNSVTDKWASVSTTPNTSA